MVGRAESVDKNLILRASVGKGVGTEREAKIVRSRKDKEG